MQGFIYSIKWWVDFPTTEYGGLLVVTAKDDGEAIQFLIEKSQANELGYGANQQKYILQIPLAVKNARRHRLHDQETGQPPEIVAQFTT